MKNVFKISMLVIIAMAVITVIGLTPTLHADDSNIRAYCQDEWPNDYRMQKYCIDKQIEANKSVWQYVRKHNLKGGPGDNLDDPYAKILHNCLREWRLPAFDTHDFRMVDYCIKKQVEAYEQIK